MTPVATDLRETVTSTADLFAAMFVRAAHDAARHNGYAAPLDRDVGRWLANLPQSVRAEIGQGLHDGLIEVAAPGHRFRLTRLGASKGPYSWFSANRASGSPGPNWEYFFQVAEYARLERLLGDRCTVGFEDGLLDISVRDGFELIWYVEVKAKATQIGPMLRALVAHGRDGVADDLPDRGKDPLRKAKYLIRARPRYLTILGGEVRRHFAVHPTTSGFDLEETDASPEIELLSSARLL